ncbi:retrovirus-related Pol polyprotein from transposon 297 [Trichonephila clavata]|uniref:Retrovirus-related Pol polyprotein from transposon 297 n=1 Tax=Trichonephila clavata TaxID=2740835 RepID=A0A8X6LWD4_TRICU|nr:retrovirus-related Pol polyprotein from transposon 297 [Trichonephila clavata]
MFTSKNVWVQHILDEHVTCLPLAEVEIDGDWGHVIIKAAVVRKQLDQGRYILGKQTIELLESDLENNSLPRWEMVNAIQIRSQRKKEQKNISLTNEVDEIELEENLVEDVENLSLVPSFKKDDKDTVNPIKINVDEVTEALLKSEESTPLIQKIEKGMNNEGSDQEEAPMQLVPVKREVSFKLYIDPIRSLHIIPTRDKHILIDMCMSPRYHETVPMPDIASITLVEALLQTIKGKDFPKELETYKGSLFISILTTKLFQKLGYKYCPSRMSFRLKNAIYYFSKLMAEHLINELVKNKFVQDSVAYLGPVVGLGKCSPAKLKVETKVDVQNSRTKIQVGGFLGAAEYNRKPIPMLSSLAAVLTELLEGNSKKGYSKGIVKCRESFRQWKKELLTNPVLCAPDFTKRFIFQPDLIFQYHFYNKHIIFLYFHFSKKKKEKGV